MIPVLAAALALLPVVPPPQEAPAARIAVDRRVELVTLAARFAGFGEYNQPVARSRYAQAADAWFKEHKAHPLFAKLRALRESRGIGFDALPSLAVHLTDSVELAELIPFDQAPERLDRRWQLDEARAVVELLRDFAEKADAEGFFDSRAEQFAAAEQRMRAVVATMKALPWFDATFGERRDAQYVAIPGLFCGGGNFGMGVRFADGSPEQILPIFGVSAWDEQGLPVIDAGMQGLFIHELCHTYTNPLVDRVAAALEAPLTTIFATCSEVMARQAYGNWHTVAYESLVRACVVRACLATEGKAAAQQQLQEEIASGFAWTPALVERLGRFEADRARWPTFVDFLPEVVAAFREEADAIERAPKLLAIEPASGSLEVDPATAELVLRFDRPMQAGCSVVGEPATTPRSSGAPSWDATKRVLTFRVALLPATTYRFWHNSATKRNFRSADGAPLLPIEVTFTTR